MLDLIVGYSFLIIAVAIFIAGVVYSMLKEDTDKLGYSAIAIPPLIVAIIFLTTCEGIGKDANPASWARVYEQQKMAHEQKMAELEIEKMKAAAALPIEKK